MSWKVDNHGTSKTGFIEKNGRIGRVWGFGASAEALVSNAPAAGEKRTWSPKEHFDGGDAWEKAVAWVEKNLA